MSQKISLLLLISLCFNVTLVSQVKTTTIEGKTFYIYPSKKTATPTLLLKPSKEEERRIFEEYYGSVEGQSKEMLEYEFKQYLEDMKYSYATKHDLKALDANPRCFVNVPYEIGYDLEPSLDPIPDGNYIQYFEKVSYGEKYPDVTNNLIAGKFTIKNNQLDGKAFWFSLFGDTLKSGNFVNGLKDGIWMLHDQSGVESIFTNYKKSYKEVKEIKSLKSTLIHYGNYKNGLTDGMYECRDHGRIIEEGEYTEGEKTGNWRVYMLLPPMDSLSVLQKIYYNSSLLNGYSPYIADKWYPVAKQQLTRDVEYPKTKIVGKSVMIRDLLNSNELHDEVRNKYMQAHEYAPVSDSLLPFDFYSLVDVNYSRSELITIALSEQEEFDDSESEGRESDEYTINYEMEGDYYEGDYYEGEYGNNPEEANDRSHKLIDSLGYYPTYSKITEYNINGQRIGSFDFTSGSLLKEDTLFYSTGKPFSVINFLPDSNQYEHKIFDANSKIYSHSIHDSIGLFKRELLPNRRTYDEEMKSEIKQIDGLSYTFERYSKMYQYEALDTLQKVHLTEKTLLYEVRDSLKLTPIITQCFDPNERIFSTTQFSIFKDTVGKSDYIFSEDYNNFRFTNSTKFGDLDYIIQGNGGFDVSNHSAYTYFEDSVKAKLDSLPQSRISVLYRMYDITDDKTLLVKNIPFTGKAVIKKTNKNFKLSANNSEISMQISSNPTWTKKVNKAFSDEKKGKKTSLHPYIKSTLGYVVQGFDPIQTTAMTIVSPLSVSLSSMNYGSGSLYSKITGNYLNGKATGTWSAFDQKGRVMLTTHLIEGDKDGEFSSYLIAKKPKKGNYEDDYYGEIPLDTLPEKPVRYLAYKANYKNDKRNGLATQYNWLGEITEQSNYVDDYATGPAYEVTKYTKTTMSYSYGQLDGLVRTMIKLPKRDSILLYELNFKDGNLQGESRSFHPNGNIAKHGFFLDGQPIDDYEAYDTLGKKYHYVKFLYSFPIEEKIYEANQLSVKYLYNWKDSIRFYPDGFEIGQGVESLLAQEGMMGSEMLQPYHGRPSLIEKVGLTYEMIKYYPNDTMSRQGMIKNDKKVGCWHYQSYEGLDTYEIDYFDTLIKVNNLVFKSKGIYRALDSLGETVHLSYIIEKDEKYDCSHTDHYEKRQFMTIKDYGNGSRMNGYAKNYYDNGTLQSEGKMANGLPTGVWKFYENDGSLHEVGEYKLGKRNGRWLKGDLSKTNFMGDICLNPNLPNLEEKLAKEAKHLDVTIVIYLMGKAKDSSYYEMDLNEKEEE
jgi:antitoxin component YwqK of YwqJK toxin-antitoxin module